MKTVSIKASEVLKGNGVMMCKGLRLRTGSEGLVVEPRGMPVAAPAAPAAETAWAGGCPSVYAVDAGTVQTTLPAVKLKGEYGTGVTALTLEDAGTVTSDYLATLEVLQSRANAVSAFLQPVLARVSVIDVDGKTIYRGMPTVVCPPVENGMNGLVVKRTVKYSDGNYQNVEATTVQASVFRLGLRWPDISAAVWGRVSHIKVDVTPQLHACDFSGQCPTRLNRYLATTVTLEVGMPGIALGAIPSRAFESVVVSALMGFDKLKMSVGTSYIPGLSDTYFQSSGLSAVDERKLVTSLAVSEGFGLKLDAGAYTARTSAINGNIALLGNLTFLSNSVYSPAEMADAVGDEAWEGSVRVSYSDGRQDMVALYHSDRAKPVTLSPLVSVPDARATTLTVIVGTEMWNIPLTPTPDGLHSYAFSINGFAPTGTGVPETVAAGETTTDSSLIVATDMQGNPLAYTRLPREVTAITPARNASGGLQFGQVCFYIFSSGGIFVARLNSAQNRIALAQIDARAVASAGLVAETSYGTVAVAAGTLVCVHGNSVETVDVNVDCIGLAWDGSSGELWLETRSGTVIMRGLKGSQRMPGFEVSEMVSSGNRVMYHSGDRWYTTGTNLLPDEPVSVNWRRRISDVEGRVRRIIWQLTSSRFKGTLSLYGLAENDDALTPVLLQRLRVNGALSRRILSGVIAPMFPTLELHIEGTAAANTTFNGCKLVF